MCVQDHLRRQDPDGQYNIIHMLDHFNFRNHKVYLSSTYFSSPLVIFFYFFIEIMSVYNVRVAINQSVRANKEEQVPGIQSAG